MYNIYSNSDSIKRPDLQIMGIEEGEEVQAQGKETVFGNSRKLPKFERYPSKYRRACRTPNRHDQNRSSPWHIIVKTLSTEKRKEH
jgi:hypothetical protein